MLVYSYEYFVHAAEGRLGFHVPGQPGVRSASS